MPKLDTPIDLTLPAFEASTSRQLQRRLLSDRRQPRRTEGSICVNPLLLASHRIMEQDEVPRPADLANRVVDGSRAGIVAVFRAEHLCRQEEGRPINAAARRHVQLRRAFRIVLRGLRVSCRFADLRFVAIEPGAVDLQWRRRHQLSGERAKDDEDTCR